MTEATSETGSVDKTESINKARSKSRSIPKTKTFSGRAERSKLEYADLLCNQELGISFGQFCASELADFIYETGTLPNIRLEQQPNAAIDRMQNLIAKCALQKKTGFGALVGQMDDKGVSELSESRYDA